MPLRCNKCGQCTNFGSCPSCVSKVNQQKMILESQIQTHTQEANRLRSEIARVQQELNSLKASTASLGPANQQLSKQVKDLSEAHKAKVDSLEKQKDELARKIQDFENLNKTLQEKIAALSQELEVLKKASLNGVNQIKSEATIAFVNGLDVSSATVVQQFGWLSQEAKVRVATLRFALQEILKQFNLKMKVFDNEIKISLNQKDKNQDADLKKVLDDLKKLLSNAFPQKDLTIITSTNALKYESKNTVLLRAVEKILIDLGFHADVEARYNSDCTIQ